MLMFAISWQSYVWVVVTIPTKSDLRIGTAY